MTDVFTKYSVAVPTHDQLCGSYMAERSHIMWPVMVSSSGQLVYFQDFSKRGHNTIQDLWSSVHRVLKALLKAKKGGAVYSVAPVHMPDEVKHVHRSLLKARIQTHAKFFCMDCRVDITAVLFYVERNTL